MIQNRRDDIAVTAMAHRGDLERAFRFKPGVMGRRCLLTGSGGGFEVRTPDEKYALLLSENMAESVSEPAQELLFPGDALALCDEPKTLQINASIESDTEVSVDLHLIFYDEDERIDTWRESKIVSSVNLLRAVPTNARSLGVVLRFTGRDVWR